MLAVEKLCCIDCNLKFDYNTLLALFISYNLPAHSVCVHAGSRYYGDFHWGDWDAPPDVIYKGPFLF